MYLPIAAEAEAASRAAVQLPAAATDTPREAPEKLPAPTESGSAVAPQQEDAAGTPLIPSIPNATRAAARWIRPLVPPFVARAIDNTTQPLRTARQVFEEVEEIAFSLKRTRKVTVNSESSDSGGPQAGAQPQPTPADDPAGVRRIPSSRDQADAWDADNFANYDRLATDDASLNLVSADDRQGPSLESGERDRQRQLIERAGPPQLRSPDGPRQLPPAE